MRGRRSGRESLNQGGVVGSWFDYGLFDGLGHRGGEVGVRHGVGGAGLNNLGLENFRFDGVSQTDPRDFRCSRCCFGAEFAQTKRYSEVASNREVGAEGGAGVYFTVRDPGEVLGLR